jgi:hypothetical protein
MKNPPVGSRRATKEERLSMDSNMNEAQNGRRIALTVTDVLPQSDNAGHQLRAHLPTTVPHRPVFLVNIDGREYTLEEHNLEDLQCVQHLQAECANATQTPVWDLRQLLDWPDEARWDALCLIHDLSRIRELQLRSATESYSDLFEAVLGLIVVDADAGKLERGRHAATEAAALACPNALEAACNRIANRLAQVGLQGVRAQSILQDAATMTRSLHPDVSDPSECVAVREYLPSAPVTPEAIVPWGWAVNEDGVMRTEGKEPLTVALAPVVITERFTDVVEGIEALKLAWYRDDQWQSRVVDRNTIANAHLLNDLAAFGVPVTSNTARALVQYLAEYEADNLATLPRAKVSPKMGWLGTQGADGFLWGCRLIRHTPPRTQENDTSGSARAVAETVAFRGADQGDEQLAAGYREAGTYEGWCQAVAPLADYPKVKLALYASLAPPLLPLLNAPNFILDFAGPTSGGKTTTLRAAASCWGCPNEKSPASALGTWDSTRVYIERCSAVLNNLPLILDDTKRARWPKDVAQTLYDVANGHGRGRGSLKGMQRAATWATVLLSSGEAPASSLTKDGGTVARVLTLWGSPFDATDEQTGQVIRSLHSGICGNYGHAGPRFVQFLADNRGRLGDWQERFRRVGTEYMASVGSNSVANRMTDYLAVLSLTAQLAHEAMQLPWGYTDPIAPVLEELLGGAGEADRALQAFIVAVDWAKAHPEDFYGGRRAHDRGQPATGWAGRWDRADDWTYIAYFPDRVERILAEAGFESQAMIRSWNDRGWLLCNSDRARARLKVRVGPVSSWMVAFKREAVDDLDAQFSEDTGQDEPETDPEMMRMLEVFFSCARSHP